MEPLETLLVDGSPLQRTPRLVVAWSPGEPRHGLLAAASVCPDAECPCRHVGLELREISGSLRGATLRGESLELDPPEAAEALASMRAELDLESGWVDPVGEDVPELRERFQVLLDEGLVESYRALWFEAKSHPAKLPWELVDWRHLAEGDGTTLVPWAALNERDPDFLEVGGHHYAALESYCAMRDCECDEVALDVVRLSGAPSKDERVRRAQHVGDCRVNLGTRKIEKVFIDGGSHEQEATVRAVAQAWRAPDSRLERARRRKRRVREIGSRILELADEQAFGPKQDPFRAAAKVAPNDRCPCGSGKKYKRCCGR